MDDCLHLLFFAETILELLENVYWVFICTIELIILFFLPLTRDAMEAHGAGFQSVKELPPKRNKVAKERNNAIIAHWREFYSSVIWENRSTCLFKRYRSAKLSIANVPWTVTIRLTEAPPASLL